RRRCLGKIPVHLLGGGRRLRPTSRRVARRRWQPSRGVSPADVVGVCSGDVLMCVAHEYISRTYPCITVISLTNREEERDMGSISSGNFRSDKKTAIEEC